MKKNNTKPISLTFKILGGLAFLTVLILNTVLFVQKDSNGSDFSLASLEARADDPGESGGGGSNKTCGTDDCSVEYGVPPAVVVYQGRYSHCKASTTGSCSSISCFVGCDAGP